ncbi:Sister chromatid cohesion protein PDS5-like protein B-B [Bienertia sinuspersici]
MALSEKELEKQLKEAGNKLLSPPPSVVELLLSLDRVENLLTRVEQSPSESMKKALSPSMKALISNELLRHTDVDVKVAVASCISEITRITAPDAPYEDDQMKEVFQLIVSSFEKLDDRSSRSYIKRTSILETVAKVRSCVVMLDLECDALIAEMFQHFFKSIRSEHHENVFQSMETIMTLVLEESEDISVDLVSSILDVLKLENKEVLAVARRLGENVTEKCAIKLKPYLLPAMKSRDTNVDDYSKVVANVLQGGSEAIEPSGADAASKNVADEHDIANAPSEKAVEATVEPLGDAPPSDEVVPAVAGSPKSMVSNGMVQKESEDTSVGDDNPKEANHEAHEEAKPSKTKAVNSDAEKLIKLRIKPDRTKKRKGKKTKTVKSTSEPSKPTLKDEKEEVKVPETDEKDGKDVSNAQSEVPVIDSAETAEKEKEPEAPVPSPKLTDEPVDLPSPSPSGGSLADDTLLKNADQGKVKDELVESVPADVDLEKESDTKNSCDESIPESILHKSTGKVPPEADKEDTVPSSVDVSMKEDEKTSEFDDKSTKQSGKKVEAVGSQREDKKKRGQGKGTPVKDLAKTPAKDEGKKSAGSAKSTAKSVKDESDVEKASKSNSKRKRTSGNKAPKYGKELVGARVQVWWPDDKEFYEGVIELFDSSTGKHKVLYNDGDIENLKLEKEKWKLIDDGSAPDQGHLSDGESPDVSAETPKAKKGKTSPAQGAKQAKTETPTKKAGALSGKTKVALKTRTKQKHGVKVDSKAKDETLKSVGKSEDESGASSSKSKVALKTRTKAKPTVKSDGKAKDETPKSVGKPEDEGGSSSNKSKAALKSRTKQKPGDETKDETLKSIGKSEDEGGKTEESKSSNKKAEDTPKSAGKSKDDDKSKQETPKTASKSKGKSPKTGSKSNTNGSSKAKTTLPAMEEETEDVESTPEPVEAPENPKGKSKSGSKSKKSSKKRKRGTKG